MLHLLYPREFYSTELATPSTQRQEIKDTLPHTEMPSAYGVTGQNIMLQPGGTAILPPPVCVVAESVNFITVQGQTKTNIDLGFVPRHYLQ
jgi:hypothetical protein